MKNRPKTWEWFDWGSPPQPLFISEQNLYKQNFNPFNHTNL